jgi:exodeoxyribonuclease VII large subunit
MTTQKPLTVSEYVNFLKEELKQFEATIVGEISSLDFGPGGHVYFSLQDEDDNSILRCALWNFRYKSFGIELEPGMEVVVRGYPDVYAPRGSLTFIVESIKPIGEGELKKAYEKLKKKLETDGLFDEDKKHPVKDYPVKIGLITSTLGAAIHDFNNNLGKYGYQVKIMDSRVEGVEAVDDLIRSMKLFQKQDVDVLVVVRGGGSLESLMAFNNELLVRMIATSRVPVIAGIGHDQDVPLFALAADVIVSTPTAAAHSVNQSWDRARLQLSDYSSTIIQTYSENVYRAKDAFQDYMDTIEEGFLSIGERYRETEHAISLALAKMTSSFSLWEERLDSFTKTIHAYDPQNQLQRGYSITKINDKIVKSVRDVREHDILVTQLADGHIESKLTHKQHDTKK